MEEEPHTNKPYQQTQDIQDLKDKMKSLFEQMETMLNLTTMLTKCK
jgi:hypothetical protein